MKIVKIKENKVIGVWNEKLDNEYKEHFKDSDKEIKVKDNINVMVGMEEVSKGKFEYIASKEFLENEKAKEMKLAKRKEIFKEVEGEEQARDTEVIFTEINKLAETIEAIISENPDLMKNKVIKENATLFGKIKEIRKG